jgi:RNA polymerase sigma-70 factor (ECF subfamily)
MATTPNTSHLSVPPVFEKARSSASLLRDARNGDREALAQLVMPYAPILYRTGLRLTKNVYDAEDVRQETLLKALSRLEQFSGTQTGAHDELQAWISRIGTNSSIDVIRRRREGKLFSLDQASGASEEHPAAQIPSKNADPEKGLLRQETKRQLAAAITELPPDLRQVCLLLDVLQYSTQEVADRLGISNVAVRLRLFRAHRRLREKLSEQFRPLGRTAVKASKKDRLNTSPNWGAANRRATPYQAIGFACGGD